MVAGFECVGVIGAGQMGAGIAQVLAMNGLKVMLFDTKAEALGRAVGQIEASVDKFIAKGKFNSADKTACLGRLTTIHDLGELAQCQLVIEAIIENEEIKGQLFRELDGICPETTVFASNTSSISITKLANNTKRADRFIGMHFMNPVPIMKLVEVISGMATSDETKQRTLQLATHLGKETSMSADYPGFVVNRILMPMINEAFTALQEGVASAEDIDKGMKLGTNQPMGPLTLADFIGLDTCLAIMNVLFDGFKDPRYRPSPLLVKYVEAGFVGKKSGRGVYQYG